MRRGRAVSGEARRFWVSSRRTDVISTFWRRSMAYSDPNFAISDRELVHEERLNDGHSITPLFALPECAHVLGAIPLRYRITRIRIVLISKEPLALQSLRFSTNLKCLFEGRLKSIPLPGKNFVPQTIRMCISVPPQYGVLRCMAQAPIGHLPAGQPAPAYLRPSSSTNDRAPVSRVPMTCADGACARAV